MKTHVCPGGNRCCLDHRPLAVVHQWCICADPACRCHSQERYAAATPTMPTTLGTCSTPHCRNKAVMMSSFDGEPVCTHCAKALGVTP